MASLSRNLPFCVARSFGSWMFKEVVSTILLSVLVRQQSKHSFLLCFPIPVDSTTLDEAANVSVSKFVDSALVTIFFRLLLLLADTSDALDIADASCVIGSVATSPFNKIDDAERLFDSMLLSNSRT